MKKVILYGKPVCPYCTRAKALLDSKGIPYQEIRIDLDDTLREEMIQKSQRQTVPQIFIDDKPIGGFDDLYALDKSGQLDKLLHSD